MSDQPIIRNLSRISENLLKIYTFTETVILFREFWDLSRPSVAAQTFGRVYILSQIYDRGDDFELQCYTGNLEYCKLALHQIQ